jgi:hypothetical protein
MRTVTKLETSCVGEEIGLPITLTCRVVIVDRVPCMMYPRVRACKQHDVRFGSRTHTGFESTDMDESWD